MINSSQITVGAITSNGSSTTCLVAYPTGRSIRADDYLVLGVVYSQGTLTTNPAGWTQVVRLSNTGNTLLPSILLSIKKAAGGETGTLTVTSTTSKNQGVMVVVPGVDLITPQDVVATTVDQTVGSSSIAIPSLVTAHAYALLFTLVGNNTGANTFVQAAGFTEDMDTVTNPSELAHLIQALAGATGTVTVTSSGTGKAVGGMMALRPAPPRHGLMMAA